MEYNERKVGVLLTYLNIFLNTAVMLFFTPVLINYLGKNEFGLYSLAMTILTYLALLDFGFGNAVVVFTSKYQTKKLYLRQQALYGTILVMYIGISACAILFLYYFYCNVDYFFSSSMSMYEIEILKSIIFILSLNIILSIPFNLFKSILTAYERFFFLKSISVVRTVLTPLFLLYAIQMELKVVDIVLIISVVNLLFLFAHYFYYSCEINFSFSIFDFNLHELKIVVKYSFFIFLALIVDQVNWNFGQFLLGAYYGAESVAVYAIAILINMTFLMLSSAVSSVLLPKVTKMIQSGASNATLTEEMIKVGRLQAFVVFSVLFGFSILGMEFIELWAGYGYSDAYLLTLILMIPLCIPLVQNLGLSILQAKNMFAFRAISSLLMSLITVTISVFLTKKYDYWGLAGVISVTLIILNGIIMNIYYHSIGIGVKAFWKEISKVFMTIALSCLLVILLKQVFYIESIVDLILIVCVTLVLNLCFSYALVFNKYEKSLIYRAIGSLNLNNI